MKKAPFFFLGLLGLGLIAFNYNVKNNLSALKENKAQLTNIHALQASADEYYCDHSSNVTCTLTAPWGSGVSFGRPVIQW